MAARAKDFSLNDEWDNLNNDFNNSTYDAQYPDDDASGGVQLDHCRLYIRNLPPNLTEDGLNTIFTKYGTLNELFLSKDPTKKYALLRYEKPGDAKLAMTILNNTKPLCFNISIAHKPKKRTERTGGRESGAADYYRAKNSREDTCSGSSIKGGSRNYIPNAVEDF